MHKEVNHNAKVMENNQILKDYMQKKQKLSLEGYYRQLPDRIAPKQKFLEDIRRGCEEVAGKAVTIQTVRNWILYGIRPSKKEYVDVISELTGINPEDLWTD